jgi:catechol 2,3-dioxygenase-like lactoylglutathione lyase family enzyme
LTIATGDEFRPPARSQQQVSADLEDEMGEQGGTRITGVGTVGVPVTDQERALRFYVDTLGFEKRMDAPFGEGLRWIEVAPPGAATTIALLPSPEGTPVGLETGIRLATDDAEADHKYLRANGVDVDPEMMRWPGVPPMFYVRDPDGNKLIIVERT